MYIPSPLEAKMPVRLCRDNASAWMPAAEGLPSRLMMRAPYGGDAQMRIPMLAALINYERIDSR